MRSASLILGTAVLLAACAGEPAATSTATSSTFATASGPPKPPSAPPTARAASPPELPSPSTSPLVNSPRITWSEVQFDGDIADIIGDGARFVAVGRGASAASAWSSPDGREWEEHDVPQQSFGELPNGSEWLAGMGALVRLGDTLYSFGATAMFMDSSVGAGWRWTDGLPWQAIESASGFFGGQVIAVTASDDALLANTIAFGGPRGTVAMWRWTSATSWVRSSQSFDTIVRALAWADGTFVAAGSEPSLWTSPDGMAWSSVALPEGLSDVCALTSTDAGTFIAFGTAGDRIAAWTSADGEVWVESAVQPADVSAMAAAPALPAACSVAHADNGLVAAMLFGGHTQVWTSRDGQTWEFDGGVQAVTTFGPGGQRVLLAGLGHHVLLAGSLSDPAEPDGSRQVLLLGEIDS